MCSFKERGFLSKVPFGTQQMTHTVSQLLAPGLLKGRRGLALQNAASSEPMV